MRPAPPRRSAPSAAPAMWPAAVARRGLSGAFIDNRARGAHVRKHIRSTLHILAIGEFAPRLYPNSFIVETRILIATNHCVRNVVPTVH